MNNSKKKSVVFIEPAGSASNVFENYMRLPLMGTLYMATILHDKGYDVRVYNENILPHRIDPYDIEADVFCISALTVSANRARLLARKIQRIYPDALLIIGGIHASLSAESFQGLADYIVSGEGESVIEDLVERKYAEKNVHGPAVKNMDELPLVNYALLQGRETMDIIPVMTSRGCPFDCNFCTVTKVFGRKFRMQSAQRVVDEIEHALSFFTTRTVFFYDDNFTANRKRIEQLCMHLNERGIDIDWVTQVRSDIANDPGLLRQMERAGCRYFFIGFESIHQDTLDAMHKSQTLSDIQNAIRVIHEHGISIHGMFIFGDDNDTPQRLHATAKFAVQNHIDTVQFMILTPFPGTQYYEKITAEDRLIHTNWDYFNGMYTVFRPAGMSPSRLQQETLKAYVYFYSFPRVLVDLLRLVVNITLDALTWNFRDALSYGTFDTVFLKGGARFLVGRYAKTFDEYLSYLHHIEHRDAADAVEETTALETAAGKICDSEGL